MIQVRWNPDLIFRQGYEILEATKIDPYFRTGLNFVSFQGGTYKLIRIIKYGFGRVNFADNPMKPISGTDSLLSALAAGIFLVPHFNRGEASPGSIFSTVFRRDRCCFVNLSSYRADLVNKEDVSEPRHLNICTRF
jgi:hypothetical protein